MARTKDRGNRTPLKLCAPIWRPGAYVRLSKDDGNDVSLSVQNQRQIINEYLNRNDDFDIAEFYVDDGYTGTDTNRENFQRMIEDVKSSRINCIIVKDLSRLSRNYFEAGYYIEGLFTEYNVRFICLNPMLDSYKSPEAMNSILVPMLNVINDDFCRQTSEKIRATFNVKRRQGEFIGAFAPYGYQKDPKDKHSFVIDEETAPVVRDIFDWFIGGMSKNGIAVKLNELGIPNPAAYKRQSGAKYHNPGVKFDNVLWNSSTVARILQNQMYTGVMVQGKQRVKSYKIHTRVVTSKDEWFIVPDTHDAIIDSATFEKVQSLQKRDTRTAPFKGSVYLFSGFVRCADCKKAMNRSKTGKYEYYVCRTYKEQSKEACTKHTIRHDVLVDAVLSNIQHQISLAVSLHDLIAEINNAPVVQKQSLQLDNLIQAKQQELAQITHYKRSIYQDWKDGEISREDFRDMKRQYEEQAEQLEIIIANLSIEKEQAAQTMNTENPALTHFMQYGNITELTREMLLELVNTIYIHEGGEITIEYKFGDHFARMNEFVHMNSIMTA